MAGSFKLKTIWNDENFSVHKGVLGPQATLPGGVLGEGIIYYPGAQKITHRVASKVVRDRVVLGQTRKGVRCLWNDGRLTEIIHEGARPTDVFRIGVNLEPALDATYSRDLGEITALLVHSTWPSSFRASIETDLTAIASLAKPFATGSEPVQKDILRAQLAKEDLEFKLHWFAQASRKSSPETSGWGVPNSGLGRTQFYSIFGPTGSKGADGEPAPAEPLDPFVKVTVNTKDSTGAGVPNCTVFANAIAHFDDESLAQRFAQFSTPTTESLSVGRYVMWAVKDKQRGKPDTIGVGLGNKRKLIVDLLAPR